MGELVNMVVDQRYELQVQSKKPGCISLSLPTFRALYREVFPDADEETVLKADPADALFMGLPFLIRGHREKPCVLEEPEHEEAPD